MKKFLKIAAITVSVLILAVAGLASYVKLALPNVGPAPDIKIDATAQRIAHGDYLANHVLVCMDCHSTRNWNEFSGPPIEGTRGKGGDVFDKRIGMPGTYYAANITPSGIGHWSDGEIFRAVTTGVRKSGKAIFPIMPYQNYGQLDEEDIKDVIAYVRSLTPIENKVPQSESEFPMSFILNTIPKKANIKPKPSPTDIIAYGKYMVTAASCAECHTPFVKGKFIDSLQFAGGRTFMFPAGMVTSANLTPDDKTGIGKWTKEDFMGRFKAYRDSSHMHIKVDINKEFNTPMPWTMFAGMKDEDLSAIYDYLRTLKPISQEIVKFQPYSK
ncbi:MAG: cytochrome C [Bacteroidetes bacterium]|nr:MAG: cytochrome C [Bacteroidota bacterium]